MGYGGYQAVRLQFQDSATFTITDSSLLKTGRLIQEEQYSNGGISIDKDRDNIATKVIVDGITFEYTGALAGRGNTFITEDNAFKDTYTTKNNTIEIKNSEVHSGTLIPFYTDAFDNKLVIINIDEDKQVIVTYKPIVVKTEIAINGVNYVDKIYDNAQITNTGAIQVEGDYVLVSDLEILYEGTGSTIYSSSIAPTNVGTYKVTYRIPLDNSLYKGSATDVFEIQKANPTYTKPTGLTGILGNNLSTVTLPSGWSWTDSTGVMNVKGIKTFAAVYTPSDTANYNVVSENLEVNVSADKYTITTNVVGRNGSITPTLIDIEKRTDVTIEFTPDAGYMIGKVTLDTVDITHSVIDNKLVLKNIKANMLIEVSYKEMSYEIIVGNNQKYTISTVKDIMFKIDGPFSLLDKVYIDDVLVDNANYEALEGSVIIKFKEAFLKTLSPGKHKLTVTFTNNKKSVGAFTVEKKVEVTNPKTSDNIYTFIILGITSAFTLLFSLLYIRKNN